MMIDDNRLLHAIYVAYWGRAADPEGFVYWDGLFKDGALDICGIAENFALCPEAQSEYEFFQAYCETGPSTITDAMRGAFIDEIYKNLFNRAPDVGGKAYWIEQMNNGACSPGMLIADIVNAAMAYGDGNADCDCLTNKISAAQYFTQQLVETGIDWTEELSDSFEAILAGVSQGTDMSAILEQTNELFRNYAPIAPAPPAPAGQDFTLTTDIDTLTGTADDDTFIADESTSQAADTVDGSGGTDTFTLITTGVVTIGDLSNIEIIHIEGGADDVDIAGIAGVTSLELNAFDLGIDRTVTIANQVGVNVSDTQGTKNTLVLNGIDTDQILRISDSGDATHAVDLDIHAAATRTLLIEADGGDSFMNIANTGGALCTVNISGSSYLTIENIAKATTFDASANTAGVSVSMAGALKSLHIKGTAADDEIIGGNRGNTIYGGAGDDSIYGNNSSLSNTIYGEGGDDLIYGGYFSDEIDGGAGNDTIIKMFGHPLSTSTIRGGDGHDIIMGGEDSNIIFGGAGNDIIYGESYDDTLYGGAGDDLINGGHGEDTIDGGPGDDILTGGTDSNFFIVGSLSSHGMDTITDFRCYNPYNDYDIMRMVGIGTFFAPKEIDVIGVSDLDEAIGLATTEYSGSATIINWFDYNGNSYVVADKTIGDFDPSSDIVVELQGGVSFLFSENIESC